jgi:ferredoxin
MVRRHGPVRANAFPVLAPDEVPAGLRADAAAAARLCPRLALRLETVA